MAAQYAAGGLLRDIVSALPWDRIASGGALPRGAKSRGQLSLKLLRLPRLLRLSRLLAELGRSYATSPSFRVLLFMLFFLFLGHWAACFFFFTGKWQLLNAAAGWVDLATGRVPWLVQQCLQFASLSDRYTASLYWALTTMFTVGYGDITPVTNTERYYTLALMLSAGIMQGVVFGNIGVALHAFDHTNKCAVPF